MRGDDHRAKLTAEHRFNKVDGPRALVCTAAGREDINLQAARGLFNFDLPWNPMDVEQRIGRIHRYGQQHTAQVYNLLVLSDTIEGRIFLLLKDKLQEIARTLRHPLRRSRAGGALHHRPRAQPSRPAPGAWRLLDEADRLGRGGPEWRPPLADQQCWRQPVPVGGAAHYERLADRFRSP